VAVKTPKVKIPTSELSKLKVFTQLSKEELQSFAEALECEQPSVDGDSLANAISDKTKMALEIITSIISLLWSLAILQRRLGVSADSFTQILIDSLGDTEDSNWTSENTKQVVERKEWLTRFFTPDSLITFSAKAGELLVEQYNVFCRVRIITDIRPIFSEDANELQGFVPFHVLALKYHEEDETKTSYFALDYKDLATLKQQIDRAEKKEGLLRKRMGEKGFLLITTGAEDNA
jgi:hypothetical protein